MSSNTRGFLFAVGLVCLVVASGEAATHQNHARASSAPVEPKVAFCTPSQLAQSGIKSSSAPGTPARVTLPNGSVCEIR